MGVLGGIWKRKIRNQEESFEGLQMGYYRL